MRNMLQDLNVIYKWAEDNMMKFNKKKFEQMSWGDTNGIDISPYKTPSGEDIQYKKKVKDLGVVTSDNISFREHINSIVTACKIKQGIIHKKFRTRMVEPMMKLFKSYIRSKIDYCCIVWSPWCQNDIDRVEWIQKSFTSKIEGVEALNYNQRLKKLKLYSLERSCERFMIINAW